MNNLSIFDLNENLNTEQVTKYQIGDIITTEAAPRDVGNEIYWDELGGYADQLVVLRLGKSKQWRVVRLGIVIGDKVTFYLLRDGRRSHVTKAQMTTTEADRFFFCRLRG